MDQNQSIAQFIEGMPKVELHLHIEGTFEPELMFEIAQRNGIALPYKSVEELRAAYNFANLQEFLDLYYQGMNVLRTEQDYYDLTMAYLRRVKAENVGHVEVFFDPQGHTSRGVAFGTVIGGISRALKEGQDRLGISNRLIMSFLRHLPEEDAFKALDDARPHLHLIDGFGLDSSEMGHPPSKFARLYDKLRTLGLPLMAHAGEEGPPEYVTEALDVLKVDRIDHGNRSLESDQLVARLRELGMGLTVCPLSNLKLCGVTNMQEHPLKLMLDSGLAVTVNSDDPAYFGGYMNANYLAVAEALNLLPSEIVRLARNAINISFMSPLERAAQHARLDAYVAEAGCFNHAVLRAFCHDGRSAR